MSDKPKPDSPDADETRLAPQMAYLAHPKPHDTVPIIVDEERQWVKPKSWKGYIWDSFDKPPAERWMLFKLDVTLLTVACTGVFIRQLDQSNINNAFVSGMKEDLGLYGNELNYMNTCFQIGYAIGQVPTTMLITKVPPAYFLAALEVSWAIIVTICIFSALYE